MRRSKMARMTFTIRTDGQGLVAFTDAVARWL